MKIDHNHLRFFGLGSLAAAVPLIGRFSLALLPNRPLAISILNVPDSSSFESTGGFLLVQ